MAYVVIILFKLNKFWQKPLSLCIIKISGLKPASIDITNFIFSGGLSSIENRHF